MNDAFVIISSPGFFFCETQGHIGAAGKEGKEGMKGAKVDNMTE